MAVGMGRGMSLICSLGALALIWFVLPRTANSASGVGVVFAEACGDTPECGGIAVVRNARLTLAYGAQFGLTRHSPALEFLRKNVENWPPAGSYTEFQDRRLKPLGHPSARGRNAELSQIQWLSA